MMKNKLYVDLFILLSSYNNFRTDMCIPIPIW